jgi:oxalate decarboxylase
VKPPPTDSGTVPNLRFSFADAHPRLESGGWAREVTERELPVATTLAGVNMQLEPGAVRELHWHKQAERVWRRAASSSSCSTTVASRSTRRSCSPTGSRTRRATCSRATSA